MYLGIGTYGAIGFRNKSPIAYGLLFYLFTISIVSNVWFSIGTNMSERLVFMPSTGLCIALVAGLASLIHGAKLPETTRPQGLLVSVGAIALIFSASTFVRNPAWKDNLTLFRSDSKTSVNSAKVHNALGGQLIAEADKVKDDSLAKSTLLEEAERHLKRAIEIYPMYSNAFFLLGSLHINSKRYPEAVKYLEQAYSLNASDANTVNNLTVAYHSLGRRSRGKRNLANAFSYSGSGPVKDYATLRLLVISNMAHYYPEALRYFEKAKDSAPQHANAWFELGMAYQFLRDDVRAQEAFAKAQQLDPEIQKKFLDRSKSAGN
jgi:tetratricopeptide (TPR) repeat protein